MDKQFGEMYAQVFDLIDKGRTAEAMDLAQQLVDANMSNESAWFAYACAKKSWGDITLAIKGFEQTVAINPKFVLGYQGLAEIYGDKEDFETAIQYLDKALEIEPLNADIMYYKVMAVVDLHGVEAAIQLCKQYIENAEEKIQLQNLLGCLYVDKAEKLLVDVPENSDEPQSDSVLCFISLVDIETAQQLCTSAQALLTLDEEFYKKYKSRANFILNVCADDLKVNRWSKVSWVIACMVTTFVVYYVLLGIFQFISQPIATIFGMAGIIAPWFCIPASRFPQYQINYAVYTGSYPWKFKNTTIGNLQEQATTITDSTSWIGNIARIGIDAIIMRLYLYKRWIKALANKMHLKA